jgi:hypothetical protein
VLLTDQMVP